MRRHVVPRERLHDGCVKARLRELPSRNVDGDRQFEAGVGPAGRLFAGGVDRPGAHRDDESIRLGNRDERLG
jgi:hypothetical protein